MLRRLESRPDWQIAMAIAVAMRVTFSAIAAGLAPFLHPDPASIRSNLLTEHLPAPGTLRYALLGIWERFDTLWYLRIANHGYDLPESVVFYPLYPGLIRTVSPMFGGIAGALLISTIACVFLFWGVIRLARSEFPDGAPFRVVMLFAVWPVSFIFFAGYTEALAVSLVVWTILFARDQRWLAAAACAFAAGLTRSMGTLLIVPLVLMAWRARRASAWPILLAPLGTLGYWTWLHFTGRLSITTAYHLYWGTVVVAPWTTLWHAGDSFARHPDALLAISLTSLTLCAVTGIVARRRTEDRCFSAAVIVHILLRLCQPPLLGATRYLLPAYPSFLTMGKALHRMKRRRLACLCAGLFVINLAWMWAFLNWSLVL